MQMKTRFHLFATQQNELTPFGTRNDERYRIVVLAGVNPLQFQPLAAGLYSSLQDTYENYYGVKMFSKPVLSLEDVKKMAAAAEAEAIANQWPVVIAIVDDGGHLLYLERMDGVAPVSAQIAPAKAMTAALGKRESRIYEEMINNGRFSFLSAPQLEGMLEGGVPVFVEGMCVGAIGVSGVKSSQDAQIAKAGIAALGLDPN